jgi:tetratricopeptide (TPR) repeat protein
LGRTLLTTRSHHYDAIGAQIDVGLLSSQEGFELLVAHRPPVGAEEEQAARGLVEDLGRHALALDVAGAALHAERGARSYAAYRAALADTNTNELELATRFAAELPGGHEASITTTLARSISELDEPGLDFLRLASRLAVDPIAPDLVIDVFARIDELDDDGARRRAVGAMHDATTRSLAERTADGELHVHTLISRTIRLLDRRPARGAAIADAATSALTRRLRAAAASGVSAPGTMLTHARTLAAALRDEHDAALLLQVALHDFYRGDYRSARRLEEHALDTFRRRLGDEHPDTLGAMNNLAETLWAQGDSAGARALYERALSTCRRRLGDEHPNTLTLLNNLAATLREHGDVASALTVHRNVLDARRRVLGDEHPDTLGSMNNLAATLRANGDLAAACDLHEQALTACRRVLGDEHPNTLGTMSNLAVTLRARGDLTAARDLHEQALAACRRVLGDEHPNTLGLMNNLAATLRAQNELAGAQTLHTQALATCRRVLGEKHPYTLATRRALDEILEDLRP